VTGCAVPSAPNTVVMPIFVPMRPFMCVLLALPRVDHSPARCRLAGRRLQAWGLCASPEIRGRGY
jgi:hypothetical protein